MEIDSLYPDKHLYHNAPNIPWYPHGKKLSGRLSRCGRTEKNTGPATALEHKHFFIFINQIGHDKKPEHVVLSPQGF